MYKYISISLLPRTTDPRGSGYIIFLPRVRIVVSMGRGTAGAGAGAVIEGGSIEIVRF